MVVSIVHSPLLLVTSLDFTIRLLAWSERAPLLLDAKAIKIHGDGSLAPLEADRRPFKQFHCSVRVYRGADKSLARPGRKQATATEDFDFHISYL